jgi:hypothetical protein
VRSDCTLCAAIIIVVTTCMYPINQITNHNPRLSHCETHDNMYIVLALSKMSCVSSEQWKEYKEIFCEYHCKSLDLSDGSQMFIRPTQASADFYCWTNQQS